MTALGSMLKAHLQIDTAAFAEPFSDLAYTWRQIYPRQQKMMLPLIDICRHLYDAFSKGKDPLNMPGVIIFHRPDLFCTHKWFSPWIRMIDSLLPNMQFIVSLAKPAEHHFPSDVRQKQLILKDAVAC